MNRAAWASSCSQPLSGPALPVASTSSSRRRWSEWPWWRNEQLVRRPACVSAAGPAAAATAPGAARGRSRAARAPDRSEGSDGQAPRTAAGSAWTQPPEQQQEQQPQGNHAGALPPVAAAHVPAKPRTSSPVRSGSETRPRKRPAPARSQQQQEADDIERKIRGARSLPELRDTILSTSAPPSPLSAAHASLALSQLAKLHRACAPHLPPTPPTPHPTPSPRSHLFTSCIRPSVHHLIRLLPALAPRMTPSQAAHSLWALSTLNCYDRTTFDLLCTRMADLADLMHPCDCDMAMSAFARFGHYHSDLLRLIPAVLLRQLRLAKPREVSQVLWGFAKLAIPGAPGGALLGAVADHVLWTMDQFGCQELSRTLWSLATLQHHPGKPFLIKVERTLVERVALLKPQDVSNALWAFGRWRYKAADLLDVLPLHVGRRLQQYKPAELSCLLYAYAAARHYHAALLDAAAPVLMSRIAAMSQQDVIMAMYSYGVFGHHPVARPRPSPDPAPPGVAAWTGAAGEAGEGEGARATHSPSLDATAAAAAAAVVRPWYSGAPGSDRDTLSRMAGQHSLTPPYSLSPANSSSSRSSSSGSSGAAPRPPAPASCPLLDAFSRATLRRLRRLRPAALGSSLKALATLRLGLAGCSPSGGRGRPALPGDPALHGRLVWEAAQLGMARVQDMSPKEMADLLYGLSQMQYTEVQVYQVCIRQLLRLLEDQEQQQQEQQRERRLNTKVLGNIVNSCRAAGYTPWPLIEWAQVRGLRLLGGIRPQQRAGPPVRRQRQQQRRGPRRRLQRWQRQPRLKPQGMSKRKQGRRASSPKQQQQQQLGQGEDSEEEEEEPGGFDLSMLFKLPQEHEYPGLEEREVAGPGAAAAAAAAAAGGRGMPQELPLVTWHANGHASISVGGFSSTHLAAATAAAAAGPAHACAGGACEAADRDRERDRGRGRGRGGAAQPGLAGLVRNS